jgi:hypothetical protein
VGIALSRADLPSVRLRHHDVEDDEVGRALFGFHEPLLPAVSSDNLVISGASQYEPDKLYELWLVVYDQHPAACGFTHVACPIKSG